ncbi:MAG: hypothetical protein ACI9TK_000004 [Flavobacteriaceae bacterium]|jgi:uncharacterized protein (TIGR02118 family)|tara:strand:+ start:15050 stop:15355 length:306 start_codon:yes stop_codon:yes gene_type:complete
MNLIVLYPQPKNPEKFESDYSEHIKLLHDKMNIPLDVKPYSVTKFISTPEGNPPFYQMFSMPFSSMEELSATMATNEMQEVAADAHRISSGGIPSIMIGKE